ncbi:aldehyde dehydrogenase (NAD+) [Neobacillus niacini]|uniref:aldehyde dehydrogenase family protein n=1 Tax=Neobacillus niacini TaxID=86668 RepID=UPI00285C2B0F|nr:aldehyde dehydrogenase family protein [Neobacillus niacini]MDR7079451.1 aldehyde dehydrogenase (NAD+) [Neobacillus niacini]
MKHIIEKQKYLSLNPTTKEIVAEFQMMNKEEIEEIILATVEAQKEWKKIPAPSRGEALLKIADLLEKRADEWGQLLTTEVGKCIRDGVAEVYRSVSILRFFAGEGYRMTGETIPSKQEGVLAYTKQQPLGTVGVITPWNVPLAIPIWKIAPALVAGNSVVWKPANQSLLISQKLVALFEEAGLPKNLVAMVQAEGPVVGDTFAENENIKAVSFTGSNKTGKIINKLLATRGIRFQAEMGGKNPFIIMADADIEQACKDIVAGGLLDAGQRCTATSRIFVHTSIYPAFREKMLEVLETVKLGPPTEEASIIGPVVDQGQYENIWSYINQAKLDGATLIYGGDEPEEEWAKNGYFIKPKLFDNVSQDMTIAKEEIFGPVLALIQFSDFDECLKQANAIEYGLSSTIYTKDISAAMKYVDEIESGLVHINLPSTYSEPQMPFGGIKSTGIGGFRELGTHAIKFYTEWKTVYVRTK